MTEEIPGQLELPFEEFGGAFEHQPDALTAFLVVVDHNGSAVATADLEQEITIERPATLADMRRACFEVNSDIAALHTAEKVMESMKATRQPDPATRIRRRLAQERGLYADRPVDAGNR